MSEETLEKEEVELTEIEQEAAADGWNPDKEKVEADGKEWVSAEEYVKRGSFFKKINEQGKVINELKSTIDKINEHNAKVAQREREKLVKEYEERISRLEDEKLQALEDGDHRKVVEIDKQLREKPPEEEKSGNPEYDREFANFRTENSWYESDTEMRQYADIVGLGYYNVNPTATPKQIFDHIKSEAKARFPNKFENENRKKPSAVDGGTPRAPKKGGEGVSSLTADEKMVYDNFERMGVFKDDAARKKYVKEVIDLRD